MSAGRIRVQTHADPNAVPARVEDFVRELRRATLIRVKGKDETRTRAVATLLHGNEPSGIRALHAWLRGGTTPAVNAVVFVGAVETALLAPGFAHRQAPGGRDLNRCFRPPFEGEEGRLAAEALALLAEARPECLIDLHNNTGHNPAYGVGPQAGPAELDLVGLFAERFVHSDLRLGALVEATCRDFPSVTIECGRAGDPSADAVARAGLERYLGGAEVGGTRRPPRMQLLVAAVRVRVRDGLDLAFGAAPVPGADLTVTEDVDRHNFEELAPGTPIGWVGSGAAWPLEARDERGRDVARELFAIRGRILETRRRLTPIMMTSEPGIARSDCLFYAVQPGPLLRGDPAPPG